MMTEYLSKIIGSPVYTTISESELSELIQELYRSDSEFDFMNINLETESEDLTEFQEITVDTFLLNNGNRNENFYDFYENNSKNKNKTFYNFINSFEKMCNTIYTGFLNIFSCYGIRD